MTISAVFVAAGIGDNLFPSAIALLLGVLVLAAALLAYLVYRFRMRGNLFNELFDQSPQAASLTTPERIIRVNRSFTEMFGYPSDAVVGRSLGELIVPAELHDEHKKQTESVARGERVETEGVRRRQDGSRFPAAIAMAPFRLPRQRPAIYTTYRDITEQRRLEEARSASEERWRAIFDSAAAGIAVTDTQGRFVATNRAYQEIVGYSQEELGKMSFMDLTWEKDRPLNAALLAEMWAGRLPSFPVEKRYRLKDGRSIWVRVTASRSPGGEATPPFGMGVVEDITERKQAEARLLEYEKVVEGSQNMIAVVDSNYHYLIANRTFIHYHGLAREQVVGHMISELVGEERFEAFTKHCLDECLRGKVVRCEQEFTFPNLGRRDLYVSYFPIEGPVGVDRVAVVLTDITERKRAEARLLEYEKVVESSHEMIAVVDRDSRYLIANQTFSTTGARNWNRLSVIPSRRCWDRRHSKR
jgi:PAS domain S-box-containing protein